MSSNLIPLYTATTIDEAMLLKGILAENGIEAQVVNDGLVTGMYPLGSKTLPQVVVSSETIEPSRKIVEQFERQLRDAPTQPENAGGPIEEAIEFDWPVCPRCDKRRQAVCDVCATAGNDFPLAEFQGLPAPTGSVADAEQESAEAKPLLMCSNCDEAFSPRYYRLCAWCNYDFQSGIEIAPSFSRQREPVNYRALLVIVLLLLGTAASLVYFWYIGR